MGREDHHVEPPLERSSAFRVQAGIVGGGRGQIEGDEYDFALIGLRDPCHDMRNRGGAPDEAEIDGQVGAILGQSTPYRVKRARDREIVGLSCGEDDRGGCHRDPLSHRALNYA